MKTQTVANAACSYVAMSMLDIWLPVSLLYIVIPAYSLNFYLFFVHMYIHRPLTTYACLGIVDIDILVSNHCKGKIFQSSQLLHARFT